MALEFLCFSSPFLLQRKISIVNREMNISLQEISAAGGVLISLRVKKEDESMRRRRALKRVDRALEKGNFKAALSLVKQMQGKPGGLLGFGCANLTSKSMSKVDDLELNGADNMSAPLLVDFIQRSIKCCLQFALEEQEDHSLAQESLAFGDSYYSLLDDRVKCLKHEAGHFLVGYLLGVLPKRYKIPTMEDLMKDNYAGGKVEFLGFEFLREVSASSLPCISSIKVKQNKEKTSIVSSKVSHLSILNKFDNNEKTLNRFLCVILGGLAAEHLAFGYSELLHSDVKKLDKVLKWSGFREDEADFQVKWAATNTVLLLTEHYEATSRLAEAMASGKSIGFCFDAIESTLNHSTC